MNVEISALKAERLVWETDQTLLRNMIRYNIALTQDFELVACPVSN